MKHTLFLLLLSALFLLGALLRGQEMFSHNFLFLLDQGRDMMAVKRIVYDLHPTLIGPNTSLQGVFQGPLWYYLLAITTFITGGDPWGSTILMFIMSISVLIVVYVCMSELFGKKAGFITLFLFAISPEAIAAATYSWNPHPMWLLIVLYVFCLYELINKKYRYHLFVWPILALMFHFQSALAIFLLIATFIIAFLYYRFIFRQRHFFIGILIAAMFFLPQILFDIRHDFLMTKSVVSVLGGKDQGLIVGGESKNYFNILKNHMGLFYYNFGTSFMREDVLKNIPLAALIFTLIALVSLKKSNNLSKKELTFSLLILRIIIVTILLTFIYPFPLRYWFLTGFQTFALLLTGLLVGKLMNNRFTAFVALGIGLIFLYYACGKIYNLYTFPDYGGVGKVKGKIDAIDFIYKDADGKPFNLLVFTPPVSTDAYDYLIWWHGSKKYNFVPKQEKSGTFYLLIEPDSGKPWSYQGWLDTVIKTGTVIETTKLPSDFIIQKRIAENAK